METRTRRTKQVDPIQQLENVHKMHGVKRTAEEEAGLECQEKKARRVFGDITNQDKAKYEGGKKNQKKASKKEKGVALIPRTVSGSLTNSQQDRNDTSWDVIDLSHSSSQESTSSSDVSFKPLEESVDCLTLKDDTVKPVVFEDIDKDDLDPFQVAGYAYDIFEYYKTREAKFRPANYIGEQSDLSSSMRAILVDWLVEVQENFELNHETLYQSVRLVDTYLSRCSIARDRLQLVGATAMFISCKFDERLPPVLDDFLFICDDAYTREHLLAMEQKMLKAVDFDLGFPLSYSFLRRYAKCAKAPLETLTLARYILEMSLMDYTLIRESDSQMAASALLLALRMKSTSVTWGAGMEHYTGYTLHQLLPLVKRLRCMLGATPSRQLNTIRTKYSHKVFHEVAKTPLLTEDDITSLDN